MLFIKEDYRSQIQEWRWPSSAHPERKDIWATRTTKMSAG